MNRIHIPEPGIRLTRAQRRQVKAKVDQQQLFEGEPLDVLPDYRLFMIVQNLSAEQRLRMCLVMREETEIDLSDEEVRWLWDDCAELSPRVGEVEAMMRQQTEDRQ